MKFVTAGLPVRSQEPPARRSSARERNGCKKVARTRKHRSSRLISFTATIPMQKEANPW
jgi:hypothetical protein